MRLKTGAIMATDLEIGTVFHGLEVLETGAVVQLVQHHHLPGI